ncbi:MAG: Gfo/Idh/MocA family protein [Actinomycetota bacterium]
MSDKLRVAVAGTGFIGAVHARSARLAGAALVGVSASNPRNAALAADRLGAERWFESSELLVSDPDVDVVHICTPNHLHAPLVRLALESGKHVVCEKPLATSASDAEDLVRAAASAGRVAAVPFVYRFYPAVREIRERIITGDLGRVHLVHGSYLQDWLLDAGDDNWRVDSEYGGRSRAFADIGSHWCDMVEFVTGQRIVRVNAQMSTAVPERARRASAHAFSSAEGDAGRRVVTTEDIAVVSFKTDGGAVGSTVISQVSAGRKNRLWFEIDGERAALAFDQEHPETAWQGRREGATSLFTDPAHLSDRAARYATLPAGHPLGYHDCFDAFVADTYEAIGHSPPPGLPVFEDGLRAVRLTEAVLDSAATGEWVDVNP